MAGPHQSTDPYESIPAGYVETDLAGRVLLANGVARELLSLDPMRPAQTALGDLVAPSSRDALAALMDLAARGAGKASPLHRLEFWREGAARALSVQLARTKPGSKGNTRLAWLIHDAQPEQRPDINDGSLVLAHQFKAPLRGITLLTHWLATDCADKLGASGRVLLQRIAERAQAMHCLVDDILRPWTADGQRPYAEAVDLSALLATVLDQRSSLAGAQVIVDRPVLAPLVDPVRLQVILQNLVENAVNAVAHGHVVVHVGCREDDHAYSFYVKDNGPGMPPIASAPTGHPVVFELDRRKNRPGHGLGLAIVKSAVERAGGSVWFDSAEGKGTTFHFTLPRPAAGALKESHPLLDAPSNGPGGHHALHQDPAG